MAQTTILCGDAREKLKELPDQSVQMCVTSPPYYGLRDYGGGDEEIGLEATPKEYIDNLVAVFREVKRVLKDDGTLWLNIGDSYSGSGKGAWENKNAQKETYVPDPHSRNSVMPKTWEGIKRKELIGIPWMLAFALREDGWYLRQDILWAKTNPMPESVTDRCTRSHEYIFLLSKQPRYYYDYKAIQEPTVTFDDTIRDRENTKLNNTPGRTRMGGLTTNQYEMRNKRDVWQIATVPYNGAHFATFPEELVKPCILAGSREGDTVLDPFNGAGTTGVVCVKLGRNYVGTELNPEYVALAEKRIENAKIELEYGIKVGTKPDTQDGISLFDDGEFLAV